MQRLPSGDELRLQSRSAAGVESVSQSGIHVTKAAVNPPESVSCPDAGSTFCVLRAPFFRSIQTKDTALQPAPAPAPLHGHRVVRRTPSEAVRRKLSTNESTAFQ